jgi:hypothetical protein
VTLHGVLSGGDRAMSSHFHAFLEAQHVAVLQQARLADPGSLGHHPLCEMEQCCPIGKGAT